MESIPPYEGDDQGSSPCRTAIIINKSMENLYLSFYQYQKFLYSRTIEYVSDICSEYRKTIEKIFNAKL